MIGSMCFSKSGPTCSAIFSYNWPKPDYDGLDSGFGQFFFLPKKSERTCGNLRPKNKSGTCACFCRKDFVLFVEIFLLYQFRPN
jgi:hypothetical protein